MARPSPANTPQDPSDEPQWEVTAQVHQWLGPHRAGKYETKWQDSQGERDEIWVAARNEVLDSVEKNPPPTVTISSHPAAFLAALRECKTAAAHLAVFAWLEHKYVAEPAFFNGWVGRLVLTSSVDHDPIAQKFLEEDDGGLLYELILQELQQHDDTWEPPPPQPSVRFAAMLNHHLQELPLGEFSSPGDERGLWQRYASRWRRYFEQWMLYQPPRERVWRLLLVPGKSDLNAGPLSDANAKGPSQERARGAVDTIGWHLRKCPVGKVVVVLLSGGQVRSETAEADFMARTLGEPGTWDKELTDKLVIVQDGLSRHTTNNLRAAAQLALRLDLTSFWVQTDKEHAPVVLAAGQRLHYLLETTWGLPLSQRLRLSLVEPMLARPCGPGVRPARGRAVLTKLNPIVFLPSIGDALNP